MCIIYIYICIYVRIYFTCVCRNIQIDRHEYRFIYVYVRINVYFQINNNYYIALMFSSKTLFWTLSIFQNCYIVSLYGWINLNMGCYSFFLLGIFPIYKNIYVHYWEFGKHRQEWWRKWDPSIMVYWYCRIPDRAVPWKAVSGETYGPALGREFLLRAFLEVQMDLWNNIAPCIQYRLHKCKHQKVF